MRLDAGPLHGVHSNARPGHRRLGLHLKARNLSPMTIKAYRAAAIGSEGSSGAPA